MRISLPLAESVSSLNEAVGGLSNESKMPGWTMLSIPAKHCKTGSKLAKVPGTVCHSCYALKNRFTIPAVQAALQRRLDAYLTDPSAWVKNMIKLLRHKVLRFQPTETDPFPTARIFGSGDLQSVEMLADIVRVARGLRRVKLADGTRTSVRMWLPTREYGIVSDYVKLYGKFPSNLTVRLSAHLVDGPLPVKLADELGVRVSGVISTAEANPYGPEVKVCPAPEQGNKCGPCRRCWSSKNPVVYRLH